MKVSKKIDQSTLYVNVSGKLNTNTSFELENELEEIPKTVNSIIMDFKDLSYLSSAGIRVLVSILKKMKSINGSLAIINVNDIVMEIFEITGLVDVLNIKQK